MDPKPDAPPPGSELKVLLAGSDGKVSLTDKFGKSHPLPPLDMMDMMTLERRIGETLLENKALKVAEIMYAIYLSMRKEGLTADELLHGSYRISEQQVYQMFDLKYLSRAGQLYQDLLKLSGLEVPPEPSPEKGNPESPSKA